MKTAEPPLEAVPFIRELLLEITRRIPPSLGPPPFFEVDALTEPANCLEAAGEFLAWLERAPDSMGERIEELEMVFISILETVQQIDSDIRRAVLKAREWVEDEMTFSHTVLEVLTEIESPLKSLENNAKFLDLIKNLLRRIELRQKLGHDETMSFSAQFDIIQKELRELKAQVAQVEEKTRKLKNESLRDSLTGIWNRKAYEFRLNEELHRAVRYSAPLSMVLWDVDHFKKINDSKGHTVGDAVLQSLSRRVSRCLRRSDFFARYGGEEFVVLLPNTDLDKAKIAGNKINSVINERPISSPSGQINASASVGLTSLRPGEAEESLFERCDRALYRAKENGRNRVEWIDPDEAE